MRFMEVPELKLVASEQRYEPLGDHVVRYSSGSLTVKTKDPRGSWSSAQGTALALLLVTQATNGRGGRPIMEVVEVFVLLLTGTASLDSAP